MKYNSEIKMLANEYLKGNIRDRKKLNEIKTEIMEDVSGDIDIEEAKKKILRNEKKFEYVN